MLDELHVSDVALIHDATLVPSSGLTVLTGETGTGKTALLSSIKLLVGERADAGVVREGADHLEVEGRLIERGGDPDGIVVRRSVSADGRGRVQMDGRMVSAHELAQRVGPMVDLCGQHEHQRLLSVATHVDLLDSWAGESAAFALAAYDKAFDAARTAADELARIRETSRASTDRLDEASFVLRRIDGVGPREGEYEELEERLPRMEHGEALMSASSSAHDLLSGDDGVTDGLSAAVRALREASSFDRVLARHADALESALIDIEDVSSELCGYADEVDFDPAELEEAQGRLAKLEGLMRAYGPRMADVFERRDRAAEVVAASQDGGERADAAALRLDQCERELAAAADALDAVRASSAPGLCSAIASQMALLEMGSASVEVSQERLPRTQWTRQGPSRVELLYHPAAGLAARPLRRIASGGEVSRVMLACKVVLGESDGCDTLVFDEVDAGVGGATAVALADVLSTLAKTHQVIVVTHLAQVAVAGDVHYLVFKSSGDLPETTIREISGEERVREVARMLSGDATETSLAHAREMLARW